MTAEVLLKLAEEEEEEERRAAGGSTATSSRSGSSGSQSGGRRWLARMCSWLPFRGGGSQLPKVCVCWGVHGWEHVWVYSSEFWRRHGFVLAVLLWLK